MACQRRRWAEALGDETLDVGQQRVDLGRIEGELGHHRVPHDDAFCQRLCQEVHGIALRQHPERRGECHRALTRGADGVTTRAPGLGDSVAPLL